MGFQTIKQCTNCEYNIKMETDEDGTFINYIKGFIEPDTYNYVNDYFPDMTVSSYKTDYINNICPFCKHKLVDTLLSEDDFYVIGEYSNYNRDLLLAMIELRKKDVIEFETKMQTFRQKQYEHEKEIEQITEQRVAERDRVHCPKCGSANIQIVPRKWSFLTGFMTNKTDRVCVNCKNKF